MTEPFNRSDVIPPVPGPAQSTTVMDPLAGGTIPPATERPEPLVPADGSTDHPKPHNPLDNVTPETPRTHPIAYAALGLAALALLLSLFGLRGDGDHGYRQVRIGANDCIIGHQGDADVLYCRAPNVP